MMSDIALEKQQKDQQMRDNYADHDCKAAPDHGCSGCLEYQDYFEIPDPEAPEESKKTNLKYTNLKYIDLYAETEYNNQLALAESLD